jgi:RimJ/RimL family protein N-acetyltransferase
MIRPATLEDAPAIAHAHVAAWSEAYAGVVPAGFLTSLSYKQRRARWEASLAENRETVLIDEREGELAGVIAFGPSHDRDRDSAETGEIYVLFVAPAFWRQHVATSLIEEAERRTQRVGARRLTHWVIARHAAGRRFCEHAGFRSDGAQREGRFRSERLKLVRYTKALRALAPPPWLSLRRSTLQPAQS